MRFYHGAHRYWCGIDLHARTMYVCILDAQGSRCSPPPRGSCSARRSRRASGTGPAGPIWATST